jgi:hypothetical protein
MDGLEALVIADSPRRFNPAKLTRTAGQPGKSCRVDV